MAQYTLPSANEAAASTVKVKPDDLIKDQETVAVKSKMMGKLRGNALLNSISKVGMFVGGILSAGSGAACVGGVIKGVGALSAAGGATSAWATFASGFATAVGGAAAVPALLGVLAVGVAFVGLAVAADYAASRIWQAGNFDNLELNARSTAKHLVEEIKTNNLCLTQEQTPCRADGKSWTQVVQNQQAAGQAFQK